MYPSTLFTPVTGWTDPLTCFSPAYPHDSQVGKVVSPKLLWRTLPDVQIDLINSRSPAPIRGAMLVRPRTMKHVNPRYEGSQSARAYLSDLTM
jgi:hypothetical protein